MLGIREGGKADMMINDWQPRIEVDPETHRVLADGPVSTVALAWPRDRTTPDVETFVGIVRGRTANSSR